jgi:hypothetical protein
MPFICNACGEEHDSLPEPAYQRPDIIWALNANGMEDRASGNDDWFVLAGDSAADPDRFFIRGTIPVQVIDLVDDWALGVWAEVDEFHFQRYGEFYSADGSNVARFPGTIANSVLGFEAALGEPVMIQLGDETQRPTFWLPASSECELARLQASGITLQRIHAVFGDLF